MAPAERAPSVTPAWIWAAERFAAMLTTARSPSALPTTRLVAPSVVGPLTFRMPLLLTVTGPSELLLVTARFSVPARTVVAPV